MSTSTQALGRGIRKLAALFGEVSAIVTDTEAYELDPYPDDDDIDELSPDLTEAELKHLEEKRDCERNHEAYIQIKRLVPNLSYRLTNSEPEDLITFFTIIQKGANDARSDDLGRLTSCMGNWLNQDRDAPEVKVFDHTPSILVPGPDGGLVEVKQRAPLFNPTDRSIRGLPNDISGGLLSIGLRPVR
ncbi:hypothetical protein B0H10DRAFT_2185830 [Mycena sp. CBHHK59/15]|nr:hypothetical protein B0H10DRAFT_2185830 [Mycena sp. CBHHK59/15]